jgi:hypothetical protein
MAIEYAKQAAAYAAKRYQQNHKALIRCHRAVVKWLCVCIGNDPKRAAELFFTGVIAVATTVYATVAYRQLKAMNTTLSLTLSSIEESHHPVVVVSEIVRLSDVSSDQPVTFVARIVNTGTAAAVAVHGIVGWRVANPPLKPIDFKKQAEGSLEFSYSKSQRPPLIPMLMPGKHWPYRFRVFLTPAESDAVRAGTKAIWFHGYLEYRRTTPVGSNVTFPNQVVCQVYDVRVSRLTTYPCPGAF